ncbi:MAG: CHAT domain-containing protein [Anaerolineae bacterium]|nr:CHAT domain-containing protein [Anaerolineae bacterium]
MPHDLRTLLPTDLRIRLDMIIHTIPSFWEQKPYKHFTNQGPAHSRRVQQKLAELAQELPETERLTSDETFVAVASAWLYEIGMQSPNLKPTLNFDYQPGDHLSFVQRQKIRVNKHLLTERLILDSVRTDYHGPPLQLGLTRPVDDYIWRIAEVCRWCSNESLDDVPEESPVKGQVVRVRLLVALLRLADQLYIDSSRVNLNLLEPFDLPANEFAWWWGYHYTQTLPIKKKQIRFHYFLPTAQGKYLEQIRNLFEPSFNYDQNPLICYLWDEHNLPLMPSQKSTVRYDQPGDSLTKMSDKFIKSLEVQMTSKNSSYYHQDSGAQLANASKNKVNQPTVFISYDHHDEQEKNQLLSHLNLLGGAGLIEVWSDDLIPPGADRETAINQVVARSEVAILLISANYLSSQIILDKMIPQLHSQHRQRNLTIIPIIAKSCAWESIDWLHKMGVLPRSRKPVWRDAGRYADEELEIIVKEIEAIVNKQEHSVVASTETSTADQTQKVSPAAPKTVVQNQGVHKMPAPEKYADFELHIAPSGYAMAQSNQGQVTAEISIEIPDDIQSTVSAIEKRNTDQELLKRFGQELFDWLFPSPIQAHLQQTEAVARLTNGKLRLRLRIEPSSLASLPLEFLYRTSGNYFLSQNPGTVLSRYLNLPLPQNRVRRRDGALNLLAIIADPSDQYRLNPKEWEGMIEKALAGPLEAGQISLKTVKRATFKEIRNALLQQKPDIIQFVGHGIYKDGKGYLALVDDKTDKTWLVDDERFANIFLGFDDHLGLVSLATCESAKSDSPQGFLGIAPKIVQRGVPAVVAMQYSVLVKSAEIFLENFYTSIAARKPVDWAVQWARNAVSIEMDTNNREFATPVLYMRAEDGEIF